MQVVFGDGEALARGEDDGPFDNIAQLADVAGPGVMYQCFHHFRWDGVDVLAHPGGKFLDEIADQGGNVLPAFAEGGEGDGEDVDAIEEVGSEMFSATMVRRSRLVAATRRKSDWMVCVPPRRSNWPS